MRLIFFWVIHWPVNVVLYLNKQNQKPLTLFLMPNWNWPCSSLSIASNPSTVHLQEELSSLHPPDSWREQEGFPLRGQPALLQVEHTEFPQPLLIYHVLLSWLYGPALDSLQCGNVFLVLERPELDTGLQMWSHQWWMEGNNHVPCTLATTAQSVAGCLHCRETLLTHTQLGDQYPPDFFSKAAFWPLGLSLYCCIGLF